MKLPDSAFPNGLLNYGKNHKIIDTITIENKELVEHYYVDEKETLVCWHIGSRNKSPILINPEDCEWLSQTFFRNENTLYGFSVIEKGRSTKLYLTAIKGTVDFDSFESLGENFAKDKYRYYYGPGGKIIKETHLELFFDQTYMETCININTSFKNDSLLKLWKSEVAISGEKVYWKGRLAKDVHSSLKWVTLYNFIDDYNAYNYDLQNIKKIEGVDIDSLVYLNSIKGGFIKSLICDKYRPLYRYPPDLEVDDKLDYNEFKPLFSKYRDKLNEDYWWFKLEKKFNKS